MRIMQVITDYIHRSILTTHGDMVLRGAAIPERLAAVAVGQILKSGGVGAKPAWAKPSLSDLGFSVHTFNHAASGDLVKAGLGFQPVLLIFICIDSSSADVNMSIGFDDGSIHHSIMLRFDGTEVLNSTSNSIDIAIDGANSIRGHVTALGAGGYTITFTVVGARGMTGVALAIG